MSDAKDELREALDDLETVMVLAPDRRGKHGGIRARIESLFDQLQQDWQYEHDAHMDAVEELKGVYTQRDERPMWDKVREMLIEAYLLGDGAMSDPELAAPETADDIIREAREAKA